MFPLPTAFSGHLLTSFANKRGRGLGGGNVQERNRGGAKTRRADYLRVFDANYGDEPLAVDDLALKPVLEPALNVRTPWLHGRFK